ncbi:MULTISPECIES: type III secretion system cytoplasmic ring protein SctQ [Paraburkholderia]|uniref:type III secretion system cytoplasmic ring protein SctQ n=1 Tax=Paraburkholderia TaxID=1822464 RepID=UPI00225B265E|nr:MULTISPECIES: type III secretion system cytoplasmic ring protein SctQ [Paraburkholderia]MCX4161452.1 type III secretion system cytoplasmic ring protein SctQ [Paraburkholderia megapolitana]MDN7156948.1 type III secretion system cytoplasmic ring protein SctQ [Paraburkholderia sp. CHISQ3]MDQ6493993.1 type III secretion system cytoplasmic ring protein SctQ [Paraburkholderia megapolitana]
MNGPFPERNALAADGPLPLPHLSAPAAQAASRAYAWRRTFEFDAGGARRTLRWDYTAQLAPGAPRRYRFRFGPAAGWLLLEARAEQALIGDAANDAVPDEIRCALLADALAPLTATLEQATRQSISLSVPENAQAPVVHDENTTPEASAAAHTDSDVSPLRFVCGVPDGSWHAHGALLFDDPRYLMLACPTTPPAPTLEPHDFDALPVPLAFGIGSTLLTQRELAALQHGDIIAIEQWKSAGAGLVCRAATPGTRGLQLNARVLGAKITIDEIQTREVPSMNTSSPPDPASDGSGAPGAAGVLDALEVHASFELERRTLTLAQLKAMQPGFVIELDQPLNQSVIRILANGMQVGTGHLIAVGNKLGVRISALGAAEPQPERDDG